MKTTETKEVTTRRHLRLAADTRLFQEFCFSITDVDEAWAEVIGCRFWCGNDAVLYANTENGKITQSEPNRFSMSLSTDDVNSLLRSPEKILYDISGLFNGRLARITKGTASAD